MQYTSEQVLSLSPNTGNATRGKKLANTAKWPLLGANENGIWGEAKGGGSKPYLAAIDFNGPAFKCSCPSREFPCKHGIGLFLLYVNEIDAFTELAMPPWVDEWINKRTEKDATKKTIEKAPVDEEKLAESKAKRMQKRLDNMHAGLSSLENWLEDIIAQGFGSIDQSNQSMWTDKAKEMTNAQCPGLGNRLQNVPGILRRENWVENLLIELAGINALIQAFKQKEQLPALLKQDVLTQLGVNTSKEDLQDLESIADQWVILSSTTRSDNDLSERKIWLYGHQSKRYALLLDFSYGGRQFDYNLPNGKTIEADLTYYPSTFPQRALINKEIKATSDEFNLVYHKSFDEVALKFSQAKSINPFVREIPFLIKKIDLLLEKDKVIMRDEENNSQFITIEEEKLLVLLSITGGQPFGVFGSYQQAGITVESILFDSKIISL